MRGLMNTQRTAIGRQRRPNIPGEAERREVRTLEKPGRATLSFTFGSPCLHDDRCEVYCSQDGETED